MRAGATKAEAVPVHFRRQDIGQLMCSRTPLLILSLRVAIAGALCLIAPASSSRAEPRPLRTIGLAEALEAALSRNPDVLQARHEIERSDALVRSARGAAIPTLTGNGTYQRLDHNRAVGGNVLQHRDQVNLSLMASAPLLAPVRWVGLRKSKDDRQVSERATDSVRRDVAVAVAHAYLTVVSQHRTIEARERAVANARDHYKYAHARYAGGIGTELDDVRAGQEVASNEALLSNERALLVNAQEALGILVGVEGGLDATDPDLREAEGSALQVDAAPGEPPKLSAEQTKAAVEGRADVIAQQTRVYAAERVVDALWADYSPTLTATFMPFFQQRPTVQFPKTGWQAQLILSLPLFDGTVRRGANAERKALLAERRDELAALLRQSRSEVRVAVSAVEHADVSVRAALQAADLARRALSMANTAYAAGATSDIEVIDAERQARDAETAAVVAEDTARRARIDLLAALGKLP
jgi:outer membrane protein TolC